MRVKIDHDFDAHENKSPNIFRCVFCKREWKLFSDALTEYGCSCSMRAPLRRQLGDANDPEVAHWEWLQQFERWEDNPTRAASQIKAEMQQQVLEYLEQMPRPPVTPEYVEVVRWKSGEWYIVQNFADYYEVLRHGHIADGSYIVPTEEAARLTAEGATARTPRVFLTRGVFP